MWCLSDAQCFNQLGSPTFTPDANTLHPQLSGSLNAAKSFIRTRKVRRFNRARNGLDSEQQLIAAGSVLVYDLEQPASQETLQVLANQGIGVNRQQGLGWIQVNPAWSGHSQPQGRLFEPVTLAAAPQREIKAETTPLLQWIGHQLDKNNALLNTYKLIQELHREI